MSARFGWSVAFAMAAFCVGLTAATEEYIVKFNSNSPNELQAFIDNNGGSLEVVSQEGRLYKWTSKQRLSPTWDANVNYIQPNHKIRLLDNPSILQARQALKRSADQDEPEVPGFPELPGFPGGDDGGGGMPGLPDLGGGGSFTDNPDFVEPDSEAQGSDPLFDKQWGMKMIGVQDAWKRAEGKDIVVAITDSGVDYTHPDLVSNMWHNKGEIPGNGVDDDKNGLVDDVIGYDFAGNDNKPYDLSADLMTILLQGGNPGHGTHVSGVVGARRNNSIGISGVAPQVKLMAVRMINETGQGDDASAIKAVEYAINNGANIINASWGGEQPDNDDFALKEVIAKGIDKGVIFVAAAGNGRVNAAAGTSAGFDNDTDPHPMIPSSYDLKNIVAVAAINSEEKLGEFSNYGAKTVDIGAPGVKILSTVPGNRYQDTVVNLGPIQATWDGTSMAAPFVSGALAVIWSNDTTQTYDAVIAKLLSQAKPVDGLKGKVATNGRLNFATR